MLIFYYVFKDRIQYFCQKSFKFIMLSKLSSRTFESTSPACDLCPVTELQSKYHIRTLLEKVVLLANSTSLDAPSVAVIWLWCFSHLYSSSIEFHHYLILFSVTWLAYSGDRLLDSIRMPTLHGKPPRHIFSTVYFKPLVYVWGLVAALSILYLFNNLYLSEIVWGTCLLFILSVYYLGCFCFPRPVRGFIPRELLVGLFFSSATHFFILIQLRHWSFYSLWTFVCFLSLCSLNCLSISRWELSTDKQVGEVTFFTTNPKQIHRFRPVLIIFICLQIFACIFVIAVHGIPLFEMSVLSSAILLLLLDRFSLSPDLNPVLADFALFTPCVFLSFI